MAGATTPDGPGDPSLVVRDGRSAGVVAGDGTLAFEVTNRGTEAVRLTALDVDVPEDDARVADGGVGEERSYEVWVDARQPGGGDGGSESAGVTVRLDDVARIEPGATAAVRVYGCGALAREAGVAVTVHTDHGGRHYETTAHLSL
jgi:hypothetical protein